MLALVTGVAGLHRQPARRARAIRRLAGPRRRLVHALLRPRDQASPTCRPSVATADVELVEADLLSAPLGPLLDDVDVVFHFAAQPGVRASWDEFTTYSDHNLVVTHRLLQAVATASPAAVRVRLQLLRVRAVRRPGRRGCADTAVQPVRRHQAGRRVVVPGVRRELRRADRVAAAVHGLRPAPAAGHGVRPSHPGRTRRRTVHGLRRRLAGARVHLRRRRRRGVVARRRGRRPPRLGLQHLGRRDGIGQRRDRDRRSSQSAGRSTSCTATTNPETWRAPRRSSNGLPRNWDGRPAPISPRASPVRSASAVSWSHRAR